MIVKCPTCNSEYEGLAPGKYLCQCGVKFYVLKDGSTVNSKPELTNIQSSPIADDCTVEDKNSAANSGADDLDRTMPTHRSSAETDVSSGIDYDRTVPPRTIHSDTSQVDASMPSLEKTVVNMRIRRERGELQVGDVVLGRYELLEKLGAGAMGVVFKCRDQISQVEYAVKTVPPELARDAEAMEEVRENFQLVHCLKHPNIASTDFLDRDEYGTYFLIMELASGENLSQWIKRKWKNGRPDIEEILEIVRQVAAALDYAHDKHILHRDIKPANVMVDEDGKVKVLDFGLASKVRSSMTALSIGPMHSSGTPNYLSPEQFQGRYPSPASDQYALGVMTYQMLAGHLPFESDDFNVLRSAVVSNPPEAIVDIPESMACALQKILNKDPQTRFGSCSEFADVLSGRKHKSLSVLLESKTLKSPIKTLQQFIAKRSNLLILAIFVVIIGWLGKFEVTQAQW